MNTVTLVPLRELLGAEHLPDGFVFRPDGPLSDVLDAVRFAHADTSRVDGGVAVLLRLALVEELQLGLFGLDAVHFVVGRPQTLLFADASVAITERGARVRLDDIELGVRFASDVLTPVALTPDEPPPEYAELRMRASVVLDEDFDLHLEGPDSVSLPPVMVGNSGIIISADDVRLDLSRSSAIPEVLAAGYDEGFLGVHVGEARVTLPPQWPALSPDDLVLHDCVIGSGGVSGSLRASYEPRWDADTRTFIGHGAGDLFGMPFGLREVSIELRQNAFVEGRMSGTLLLPFFDGPLEVDLHIDLDGGLAVEIAGADGLGHVRRSDVFDLTIETIGFSIDSDRFLIHLSGSLELLFGRPLLDWPTFEIESLTIDSEGNVAVDGGWLDLREQYHFDFYSFGVDIARIGIGTTADGGRFIGCNGTLSLVEGLPVGASVEGLRVYWYDDGRAPRVTLQGVGVELTIPNVLHFKGEVAYREVESAEGTSHRFDGAIDLHLDFLETRADGALVIGAHTDANSRRHRFMAIYLGVELPGGIPLWATGLGVYGMTGMFAHGMAPDRRPDEPWFAIDPGRGWYGRAERGATDLGKWEPRRGGLAFGAGLTLGTLPDNGHLLSASVMLLVSFPGPLILIEGKADILRPRRSLSDDALFHAIAVLDGEARTFLLGLDARYRYPGGGQLIDIGGGVEVFFDFDDPSAWYLHLGKREPRSSRLRARFLSLFQADAYFMLDPRSIAMGAWLGWDVDWRFGPISLVIEAWVEGNAALSWSPPHFHGDLTIHGRVIIGLFGIRLGLGVHVLLSADVFDPFHLLGRLEVSVYLPWPLPDIEIGVRLEWGPELRFPPLADPVDAVAVEHVKATASWPLPAGELLQPVFDRGDGYLRATDPPAPEPSAPAPASCPVVPLDGRPSISFAVPVNDDARVGVNPQPITPEWHRIGDPSTGTGPARARFALQSVELYQSPTGEPPWQLAAAAPARDDVPAIYGSWAPVSSPPPTGTDEPSQTKLSLWSRNPFDYTRYTGREWIEWFTARFQDWPCVDIPERQETCYSFDHLEPGPPPPGSFHIHPDDGPLILVWRQADSVRDAAEPVEGFTRALCFLPEVKVADALPWSFNLVGILIPGPNTGARLVLRSRRGVRALAINSTLSEFRVVEGGTDAEPVLEIDLVDVRGVFLIPRDLTCLYAVCAQHGPTAEEIADRQELAEHFVGELERWYHQEEILAPYMTYRLRITTAVEAVGEGPLDGTNRPRTQTRDAWFRTEGPPALASLSPPELASASPEPFTGLDDLTSYVEQTIPPTIPAPGQQRRLVGPVFRGYDVGVAFEATYVEAMYQLARRDLILSLYDDNDEPVRDAAGRIVDLAPSWQPTPDGQRHDRVAEWITTVTRSGCGTIDEERLERKMALSWPGHVLAPDTSYDARLEPLLLRETFGEPLTGHTAIGPGGGMGGWRVVDVGDRGVLPSRWEFDVTEPHDAPRVIQRRPVHGELTDLRDVRRPGAMLIREGNPPRPPGHPDSPWDWSALRASVVVRSGGNGAVGLVVRYRDPEHHYRVTLDWTDHACRLVSVVAGRPTILAEAFFALGIDTDYRLEIEAIGGRLTVFIDGAQLLKASDGTLDRGSLGLYCWANVDSEWRDLQVRDLRASAPVAYRFRLRTSRYSSFVHQLHDRNHEPWVARLEQDLEASRLSGRDAASRDDDAEHWDYDTFVTAVLGAGARQDPSSLEITRVEDRAGARLLAFLVRGPEPFDFARTSFQWLRTEPGGGARTPPGRLAMIGVEPAGLLASEERVQLMAREDGPVADYRVEALQPPGPIPRGVPAPLLDESFAGPPAGQLYMEQFGESALDRYDIVDEGRLAGPSRWRSTNDHIEQTSAVFGGSVTTDAVSKPGTLALLRNVMIRDFRLDVGLRSGGVGAIGVVFRYRSRRSFLRFSMDHSRQYARLIEMRGTEPIVLWQKSWSYERDRRYALSVRAFDDEVAIRLDDSELCVVRDHHAKSGRVGLYCWANPGAVFDLFELHSASTDRVIADPDPRDVGELWVYDEAGTSRRSAWRREGGALVQRSSMTTGDLGASLRRPGSIAVADRPSWRDYRAVARMSSSSGGALGIVFRYRDSDNHYRLSFDNESGYQRLVVLDGGVVTAAWERRASYPPSQVFQVMVDVIGDRLVGWLDGERLFDIRDRAQASGGFGLYTSTAARFDDLLVTLPPIEAHLLFRDRFQHDDLSAWEIVDEGTRAAPSDWRIEDGVLLQASNIHEPPLRRSNVTMAGTIAVAGNPDWTDVIVSARLSSADDDAIGLVFRYLGPQHHYRLSMDRQRRVTRLVRRAGEETSVLWEERWSYELDVAYELTIVSRGSMHEGYINDVPMFAISDDHIQAGRIGLYCAANTGARFAQIRVLPSAVAAAPAWSDDFTTMRGPVWSVSNSTDPDTPIIATIKGLSIADVRIVTRFVHGESGSAGVILRRRGDRYYRVTFLHDGAVRVSEHDHDAETVLWQGTHHLLQSRENIITVDCIDDRLQVYANGAAVCRVAKLDASPGTLGICSSPNATFNHIALHSVDWKVHHRLRGELPCHGGTVFDVRSDSSTAASPNQLGRIRTTGADRVGFVGDEVDLRIAGPTEVIQHRSRFHFENTVEDTPYQLLRKRDGTGFAILAASEAGFGRGDFHLRAIYALAGIPDRPRQSRQGRTESEITTVYIPWTEPDEQ